MAKTLEMEMIGIRDLINRLAPKNAMSAVVTGMTSGMLKIEREAKVNLSGRVLKVRSGFARASVGTNVDAESEPGSVIGAIFGLSYLKTHEGLAYGREWTDFVVIVPKRPGGALAIPLQRGLPLSPRSLPGLWLFKSIAGSAFLARTDASGGLELLYLLVRSVKIPVRKPIGKAVAETLPQLLKDVGNALKKALMGGA